MDLADRRRDYDSSALDERDVSPDPLVQFAQWYSAAEAAGIPDANAAALATAHDGRPAVRIILLKGVVEGAFQFFTNWESRKAHELDGNPQASLLFFWQPLERQVRIEGTAVRVTTEVADAYFATRPRESQLGAWASPQSATLPDRDTLIRAYKDAERRFGDAPIPRPVHWGGYALTPSVIEFWQGRAGRLHDRLVYRREKAGWSLTRLAP
ncbi:MAG: pyridoxamine 5'-phosphate oxidase [Gemmatimonadales bacterium]